MNDLIFRVKKNKNLALFMVLILGLILTYIFEEKRNKDQEMSSAKQMAILDISELGDLVSFNGIKLNVIKKDELYYANDNHLLLSNKKLDEFFKILSGLKIKSILSESEVNKVDRSFYIPNQDLRFTFKFKKGDLSFTLGKKLEYDQTFYMEVQKGKKTQMLIVADDSADPNTYQSDSDYRKSDFKYNRLTMIFYLTNVFFYETKVFNSFSYVENRINFKQIDIATFRNKKFSLDFEKSVTIPKVTEGLEYFDDNWVSFHRTLTTLEAKTVYFPYEPLKLDEALSELKVVDREGKKYTLELYKKYGSLPGYFLKTSFDKILYELRAEDAKYFFVNIQDFWKKRIYPSTQEFSFKISFPKDTAHKDSISVEIKDKEMFEAHSVTHKIKNDEIKKLIDFMKMEGDNVSDLTENPTEIIKHEVLKLYFANRDLSVILEENDVVVVDFKNKLKIHHYVGATKPFGFNFSDYFEK